MTRPTVISLLFLVSAAYRSAGGIGINNQEFHGRIAAYRLADRMQVGSFAANKEKLIFQPAKTGELLKLVYEHQGYSDLKGEVISGATPISITVHRDKSCDESLGEFEADAPAVPIEGGGAGSTEPVIFAPGIPQLSKSYRLKCYVLKKWFSKD